MNTMSTKGVSTDAATASEIALLTDAVPSFDTIYEDAIKTFRKTFDAQPDVAVCAPGRVNLIGEHIDYNDGFVLPMVRNNYTIMIIITVCIYMYVIHVSFTITWFNGDIHFSILSAWLLVLC